MEILPRNVLLASWLNSIREGKAGFDDLYQALGTLDRFSGQPAHEALIGSAHAFFVGNQELLHVGSKSWLSHNKSSWEASPTRVPEIHTHSLKEAARLLSSAVDEALHLLSPIEVASDRGVPLRANIRQHIADVLRDSRSLFPPSAWKNSGLIERGITVLVIAAVAALDNGGAVTAHEINLRSLEIGRLRTAAREALVLGTEAWSARPIH
ncbi:MAG: hypothetical protein WCJ91_02835 [Actinomycetes bacterium]